MSRYGTREDDVDRLLRGRMFVDLHRVVRPVAGFGGELSIK